MTFSTRAAWYGYPTPAEMDALTVTLDADSAHVVAEGLA
ncbi:hypothetical protein K745_gp32 [Haloarcula hispanica virus PH1]|uniref:Uncharacterized protein n=1 Tax=Haloarcula hispanica virus PH1 TaxID=1282967 RepID=M4JG80_9VIRU|nr:hypothetical protein K745_gp32 [Haloarcula hispanica virus PH1]AGC65557.1 hypothetical protein HhPH1_gp32 [Haloarcula hispanica virus PH1]